MLIDTLLYNFGQYILLLKSAIAKPERFSMYYKETVRQMDAIGVGSVFIVLLISVFIGMVTAVQFADQLGDSFIPSYYIGYIVRDITIIEMAPTITCLVLAGKVGSNLAAEIGGMRQKEHIDAMEISSEAISPPYCPVASPTQSTCWGFAPFSFRATYSSCS